MAGGGELSQAAAAGAGYLPSLRELGLVALILVGIFALLWYKLIPAWERLATKREEGMQKHNDGIRELLNRQHEDGKAQGISFNQAINRMTGVILAQSELLGLSRKTVRERAQEVTGEDFDTPAPGI